MIVLIVEALRPGSSNSIVKYLTIVADAFFGQARCSRGPLSDARKSRSVGNRLMPLQASAPHCIVPLFALLGVRGGGSVTDHLRCLPGTFTVAMLRLRTVTG